MLTTYYKQWAVVEYLLDQIYVRAIKNLVEHGADVNVKTINGETPLDYASRSGHNDCIKMLLGHNANINTRDRDGNNPFHKTVFHKDKKCMITLLEYGANINVKNNQGQTAFDIADQNTKEFIINYFKSI